MLKYLLPLLLLAPLQARGDADDIMAGCIDPFPDIRVVGCTAAIDSGIWEGGDLAWAYNNRAIAYRLMGQWEDALEDFSIAIGLDPENPINWNNRGHAHRVMGAPEKAIVDFDWAIALDPDYRLAHYNRATALAVMGDLVGAVASYSEAIRLAPEDPWGWNDRGLARHRMGDLDAALKDFDAALERAPERVIILNNRANTLCKLGEVDAAIDGWAEAMLHDPAFAAREQEWLTEQGFYDGPLSGAFDTATAAAQRRYAEAGCPGV